MNLFPRDPPATHTTAYNLRTDIEAMNKLHALCVITSGCSYGWLVGDGSLHIQRDINIYIKYNIKIYGSLTVSWVATSRTVAYYAQTPLASVLRSGGLNT